MATYVSTNTSDVVVLDKDGVVLDERHEKSRGISKTDPSTEEPYIKLYLSHVGAFFHLPESATDVLLGLCSHANLMDSIWAGRRRDARGRIIDRNEEPKAAKMYLNGELKKDVCESLGISMPTLNRRLKNLCDKEILRRVGTGTYQLNPYILARGNWAEITELRTTFDYVNGTVTTEMKCIDSDTNETVKVM